jgi:membrane glycosyltransferase
LGHEDAQPAIVPCESPLPMPIQELWSHERAASQPQLCAYAPSLGTLLARSALLILTLAATTAFAWAFGHVLTVGSMSFSHVLVWVLCTLSFAWVAFGTANMIVGLVAVLFAKSIDTLELPAATSPLTKRTALLYPIYYEDPVPIAASVEAVAEDLHRLGRAGAFDVFILSDTQGESDRRAERRVFFALSHVLRGRIAVFYRGRHNNRGKKAGNVHEWVERFGSGYEHFVILDADSLMSGTALVRLAAAMERNPAAGLIQTVPRLVGGRSLFAKLQEFANAYYGPVVAAGFAAWQGASGNYWGHNAIVRTHAFAQSAGLPTLDGAPPLGGHIQSHDFVEAALLRRAGWGVHMVPSLSGSYEASPPTLVDHAIRDRRWAQGNMQHLRLIAAKGLRLLSRLHLGLGALSYIVPTILGLSLAFGLWLTYAAQLRRPEYFPDSRTLFPVWPVYDPELALSLFLSTLGVVFLPKALGIAAALVGRANRTMRGLARLVAGTLIETLLSILLAPVQMVMQMKAFFEIAAGRDSGWGPQRREGQRPALHTLVKFHGWQVAAGVLLALACFNISWHAAVWMSPVIAGLLLSLLLSWWTALPAHPRLASLISTPEVSEPPQVLRLREDRVGEWRMVLREEDAGSATASTAGP